MDNNFVNQSFLGPEALTDNGLSLSYVIPPNLVGNQYIEAVAEIDGRFRMLDLTSANVRKAIADAVSAKSAYAGPAGADYATWHFNGSLAHIRGQPGAVA